MTSRNQQNKFDRNKFYKDNQSYISGGRKKNVKIIHGKSLIKWSVGHI